MTGAFQSFRLTHDSFGQQYTTIDGEVYLTWFDVADVRLRGLGEGAVVEFEVRPAPTVLCESPAVREDLPSATLLRVVKGGGCGD
jgi:hypothetical protein